MRETSSPLLDGWDLDSRDDGGTSGLDEPESAAVGRQRASSVAEAWFRLENPDDDRGDFTAPITRTVAPTQPSNRGPITYPSRGDVVGGFRVVKELGRGAFARVYLAEQVELAGRSVAIKVAEALGDEPQALAKLQHTHIVPIHSIHDDQKTGLRLLCMPYVGGANLAQVLECSGARLPSQADGRSLIDALDSVGGRPPSLTIPSRRSITSASSPAHLFRDAATRGVGSPSVVRSILGRYWARLPWWSRLEEEQADELPEVAALEVDQPARRFLRSHTLRPGGGVDRGPTRRGARSRPRPRPPAPRHQAVQHPDRRGRHADAPGLQLGHRIEPGAGERRGGEGHARRDPAVHGPRAPGRVPPQGHDQARGRERALGHLRPGAHPLRDAGRPARVRRASRRVVPAVARHEDDRATAQGRSIGPGPSTRWCRRAWRRSSPSACNPTRAVGTPAPPTWRRTSTITWRIVRTSTPPSPASRNGRRSGGRRHPQVRGAGPVAALAATMLAVVVMAALSVYRYAEGAHARLLRGEFRDQFARCQLLLNTTSGPATHRIKGAGSLGEDPRRLPCV